MRLSQLLALHPHLDLEVEPPREGTVITEAILLCREVWPEDNTDALGLWATELCSGLVQYGIVCAAKVQLEDLMLHPADPE